MSNESESFHAKVGEIPLRKLKDNSTGSFDFAQDDSFDFHWTYSAKSSRFGDWYGNKVDVVRPTVSSRRAADFFARIKAAKRESRDARDDGRGNDLHINVRSISSAKN